MRQPCHLQNCIRFLSHCLVRPQILLLLLLDTRPLWWLLGYSICLEPEANFPQFHVSTETRVGCQCHKLVF